MIFDRKVEPEVRKELQRKATLMLKMLLEDEPENPKYVEVYTNVLKDVASN